MFTFAIDYFLFVFIACFGVIQIAASLGGLEGLLLLKKPLIARAIGLTMAILGFVWFFTSEDRNINDYEGGLDANVQALFFFFGGLTALTVTLVTSSLLNMRMNGAPPAPGEGLGALSRTSYIRGLIQNLRYWRREWRTQIKPYFFG